MNDYQLVMRMNCLKLNIFLLILVVLMISGCASRKSAPGETGIMLRSYRVSAGRSIEGRAIETVNIGHGSEVVMVVATIHGNEWAGTPLVKELEYKLLSDNALLDKVRVVIVPEANPDGRVHGTRGNANGVDLNRNFPAGNRVDKERYGLNALSEPESQVLHDLVAKYQPTRILTLHQPLACIDWDGPGEGLAKKMAGVCELPAKKLGSRPGSMGSYVGNELGVPIITLEFRRDDERLTPGKLWELYGAALMAFIEGEDGGSVAVGK